MRGRKPLVRFVSSGAASGFDNWSIKRVDPLCPKLRLYSSNNSLFHSNVAIFLDIIQHEKSESISGNRMLEQGKAKSIITHLPSEAKLCNTKYLAPLCRKLHSVNRPARIWGSLPLSQGKKTTTISRCSHLRDTNRMTERLWGPTSFANFF